MPPQTLRRTGTSRSTASRRAFARHGSGALLGPTTPHAGRSGRRRISCASRSLAALTGRRVVHIALATSHACSGGWGHTTSNSVASYLTLVGTAGSVRSTAAADSAVAASHDSSWLPCTAAASLGCGSFCHAFSSSSSSSVLLV